MNDTFCCAVCRGNYPPPPVKYSGDLRCLISELFRRNPRYDSDRCSVSETVSDSNDIYAVHCDS